MRCNFNCFCNRNCNRNGRSNCGGCRPCWDPSCDMAFGMNSTNVFAGGTFSPATITGAATTPIAITNILYSYGRAIQAPITGSSIYITEPGLYQVAYVIGVTNTSGTPQDFTVTLTRNMTPFAPTDGSTAANGGMALLADTQLIYVAPQELPLTLALNLTNTGTSATYGAFITVNRICSCIGECGYMPTTQSGIFPSVPGAPLMPPPPFAPEVPFGPLSPCLDDNGCGNRCCDNCCD